MVCAHKCTGRRSLFVYLQITYKPSLWVYMIMWTVTNSICHVSRIGVVQAIHECLARLAICIKPSLMTLDWLLEIFNRGVAFHQFRYRSRAVVHCEARMLKQGPDIDDWIHVRWLPLLYIGQGTDSLLYGSADRAWGVTCKCMLSYSLQTHESCLLKEMNTCDNEVVWLCITGTPLDFGF